MILAILLLFSALAQTPPPPITAPTAPPPTAPTSEKALEQYNAFGSGSGGNQALLVLHGTLSRLPPKEGAVPTSIVTWDDIKVNVVETATDDGKYKYEAELKGQAKDLPKSLIINYRPVKIEEGGHFTFKLIVDKPVTEVLLNVIQPDGKLQTDPYALTISDWDLTKNRDNIVKKEDPRKFFFNPGLGLTFITYSQTNTDVGTLSPIMLTAKIGADYRLPKNWVLGFVGFINLVALSGATDTTQFRFIGLNLRAGKKLNWLSAPWELTLSGGLYYLTMITSGNFGFSNVAGPQLYPTVRYSLNNGGAFFSYFKFSPISQGFTLMSFTNFELALGLHYQFPRTKKFGYSVGIDLSQVALTTLDQNNVQGTANSRTISLGGSMSF